ncbi:nitrite reductase/ring-hydroxylating ferredoxin subunit [Georgenia soli]|uniref:Nitrite reductase/ring-hydroxylating ferredoxin subunit n=1 Tax=Georgenia soli TaxID=638953 RepID=A0A2A9ELM5_9MICO|nr:Rieske (2Fe-2S) protein [Georgenia soli]PFG39119.1 nitrite reductase/ring-hydroxylating ferredoxin subunit [Georgenia soli]
MFLAKAMRSLEKAKILDPAVDAVVGAVNTVLPPGEVKDALHGKPLGHALHPMLVTLPIGLNIGVAILDLAGGKAARPAAQRLLGAAILSVAPAAAAGLADWSELGSAKRPKRVGLVHAGSNVVASSFFVASWFARRAGRHTSGKMFSMLGMTGLGVGGYLGGHLAYAQGVAVNRNADRTPKPREWKDAAAVSDLEAGMVRVEVSGQPVLLTRHDGELYATGAVCSHMGGPLEEGELEDGCVVCPWHGSHFRLADGEVERGPASVGILSYDVRVSGDRVEVRARG